METCVKCKRSLPEDRFSASVLQNRMVLRCKECVSANKRRKRLLDGRLKPACVRCGQQIPAAKWRRVYCSHECGRRAVVLRAYGLPPHADLEMLREQDGNCGICAKPLGGDWSQIAVDHCHTTKRVRGLLHERCNRQFRDNEDVLFGQQVYLARQDLDLISLCVGAT